MKIKIGGTVNKRGKMEMDISPFITDIEKLRQKNKADEIAIKLFDRTVDAIKENDCGAIYILMEIAEAKMLHHRDIKGRSGSYEDVVWEVLYLVNSPCLPADARFMDICGDILRDTEYCRELLKVWESRLTKREQALW